MPIFKRVSKTSDVCPYCVRMIEAEQVKRRAIERLLYSQYSKWKCMNCFRTFFKSPELRVKN